MTGVTSRRDEPRTWLDFWTREHAIYAGDRHREAHYRRLAEDIPALVELTGRTVLDFGCGEALATPRLAAHCGRLLLYDPVPGKAERWRGSPGVTVLTQAEWLGLPAGSVDVMLVVSVVQYLPMAEFQGLLERCQALLRPGGTVLFADVVPPDVPLWHDVGTLLRAGWHHGFFVLALLALLRIWRSPYRRLRSRAGFATYTSEQFISCLSAHGLGAHRLPRNVGFSRDRMAFLAVKADSP